MIGNIYLNRINSFQDACIVEICLKIYSVKIRATENSRNVANKKVRRCIAENGINEHVLLKVALQEIVRDDNNVLQIRSESLD